MKYKALDLFSGGGGACIGMQQAGFEVFGIDIVKHKNYPGHFIQADIHALPVDVMDFDFVWASPPCQKFSLGALYHANKDRNKRNVDLIPETREAIERHPFTCIENVPMAPIRKDLVLVGPSVGLFRIERRRHFECSFFPGLAPPLQRVEKHLWDTGLAMTITKSMSSSSHWYRRKALGMRGRPSKSEAKDAMGIPQDIEMTYAEIGEAVPPPYSRFIAERVIEILEKRKCCI